MSTVNVVTVGFNKNYPNIVSRMIRDVTKSPYSHCWFRYYHPYYEKDIVVEAGFFGVVERVYDTYVVEHSKHGASVIELVPPAGTDLMPGLKSVGEVVGSPYDYASLVGRLWVYLMSWLGRKVKNPWGNPREDVCVENAIRMLRGNGMLKNVDQEVESPQSLYNRLLEAGWTIGFQTPAPTENKA